MSRLRSLVVTASALALAACAAGPDYVASHPSVAASGPFLSTVPAVTPPAAAVEGKWWQLYNDPVLDRLGARSLAANTDIRVAVANLAKARASLREARTDRLPDIGTA